MPIDPDILEQYKDFWGRRSRYVLVSRGRRHTFPFNTADGLMCLIEDEDVAEAVIARMRAEGVPELEQEPQLEWVQKPGGVDSEGRPRASVPSVRQPRPLRVWAYTAEAGQLAGPGGWHVAGGDAAWWGLIDAVDAVLTGDPSAELAVETPDASLVAAVGEGACHSPATLRILLTRRSSFRLTLTGTGERLVVTLRASRRELEDLARALGPDGPSTDAVVLGGLSRKPSRTSAGPREDAHQLTLHGRLARDDPRWTPSRTKPST